MEHGYQFRGFVSAEENILEDSAEEEKRMGNSGWAARWRAEEVGEAGWKGALGVRAELAFRVLMLMVARGDKRPLDELAMMAKICGNKRGRVERAG